MTINELKIIIAKGRVSEALEFLNSFNPNAIQIMWVVTTAAWYGFNLTYAGKWVQG